MRLTWTVWEFFKLGRIYPVSVRNANSQKKAEDMTILLFPGRCQYDFHLHHPKYLVIVLMDSCGLRDVRARLTCKAQSLQLVSTSYF